VKKKELIMMEKGKKGDAVMGRDASGREVHKSKRCPLKK